MVILGLEEDARWLLKSSYVRGDWKIVGQFLGDDVDRVVTANSKSRLQNRIAGYCLDCLGVKLVLDGDSRC